MYYYSHWSISYICIQSSTSKETKRKLKNKTKQTNKQTKNTFTCTPQMNIDVSLAKGDSLVACTYRKQPEEWERGSCPCTQTATPL